MNRELIEDIKAEIKETREFFKDDEHYDEVFEQAGWDEENMRIFDVGLIRGLQYVLNKLQENNEDI